MCTQYFPGGEGNQVDGCEGCRDELGRRRRLYEVDTDSHGQWHGNGTDPHQKAGEGPVDLS